jgi:hypothetical protein
MVVGLVGLTSRAMPRAGVSGAGGGAVHHWDFDAKRQPRGSDENGCGLLRVGIGKNQFEQAALHLQMLAILSARPTTNLRPRGRAQAHSDLKIVDAS